ncbi:hypothetical protein KC678_02665 [Candidatus Dojkabacteria bacterium]|uniref:Uncharacterized protein n=1 Tax=Candidatus Dojkabacteria bacterium TaxID=2099670 RepID=A0A955I9H3_9BACT|nr:hypothetical protein [Candidatus Dojkabacteria bacterium]
MRIRTSSIRNLEGFLGASTVTIETHDNQIIDVTGPEGKPDVVKYWNFIKPEIETRIGAMDYGPILCDNKTHLGAEIKGYYYSGYHSSETYQIKIAFIDNLRQKVQEQSNRIPTDQRENYNATLEVIESLLPKEVEA